MTDAMPQSFEACRLCPRECGVNRLGDGKAAFAGFCGQNHRLRVAHIGPHFGEEPPISGRKGSGTVFFSGCSLRCSFCQNHQISQGGLGRETALEDLLEKMIGLIETDGVHNINLVTPDHFAPLVFRLVARLRSGGYRIPLVFNLSGYQSQAFLRAAEEHADIYLPDYKYADPNLAAKLSRCRDYPRVGLEAIAEMVRQKGFLADPGPEAGCVGRGVLVRHLILPGCLENSLNALTSLFLEFGPGLPLSLMSQYTPVLPQEIPDLNRSLTREEFERVYAHARDLGFEHLYIQFPRPASGDGSEGLPFLPDFRREKPFAFQRPEIDIPEGDC